VPKEIHKEQKEIPRREFLFYSGSAIAVVALGLGSYLLRERPLISDEERQEVIDALWKETQAKHDSGVTLFPWPEGNIEDLRRLNHTERIRDYTNALSQIWQNRNHFWTPYDELSWQTETFEASSGIQISRSMDFWMKAPLHDVSSVIGSLNDNLFPYSLEFIHHTVFSGRSKWNNELGEISRKILEETLFNMKVGEAVQLKDQLPSFTHTLFSLPRFAHLEASIKYPFSYPDPYLSVGV